MTKDSHTLHLVLKHKWYDLIASGKKKVEYRAMSEYWSSRLLLETNNGSPVKVKTYDSVVFHKGYTSIVMEWEIKKIDVGHGDPVMGADPDYPVFRIHLGERLR